MKWWKRVNWDRVVAAVATVAFLGVTVASFRPGPKPGPGPQPAPNATGEHVVVVVDDSAPTIPQGIILDGPESRALKLAGKMPVVGLTEKIVAANGYPQLITEAGGAPAVLIFDHDGGLAAKPTKLPSDAKAWHDLLAKSLTNLPPPLAAWPAARVVDRGGPTPVWVQNGLPYVDVAGHRRYLSARSDPVKLAAEAGRYGDANPLFPVNEWRDIDRRNVFGSADWIYDQDGINSCVANGGVRTLRCLRALAGMNDVKLSPGFLYAHINGGRDEGAVVSDVIGALKKFGSCSFDILPQKPFYLRQLPAAATADALRFPLVDAYRCSTWKELISALQTGRYVACFGIQVGNTWGRFDQYGVCGHDRGPGNHCVMADGCRKLPDGRLVLDMVNSWGATWGPFKNGRAYLDEQHLFGGGDQPDICVFRIAGRDPQDPFAPPAYKGK